MEYHPQWWPEVDVQAPTLDYNPSAWSQRIPIAVLAAVAAVIAAYMAAFQWGLVDTVWDPVFGKGSANVLQSDASSWMERWMGMPDAALGAIAYAGDAVFGMAGSTRRWQYRPWLVVVFGIDVIPLGLVSAILVVVQGFVVGSWCFLCLVTAVISLVLVVMAWDEVIPCLKYLRRVRQRHPELFWKTFWGHASPEAERVALEMIEEG